MFRLVSHLRPSASVTASRLGLSSTVYAVTQGNTSQYGVRHLSSLRPAKPGSNHGSKTDSSKNMPQDNSVTNLFSPTSKKRIL